MSEYRNRLWRVKTPQVEASSTYVREKRHCAGVRKRSHGMVEIKLLYFRWPSPFFKRVQKGFPGLLKVRPSSLFMLYGCISSSMASLMS